MNLKTTRSITAGKSYVPTNVKISKQNGLYEARQYAYDEPRDLFAKEATQSVKDPPDPLQKKVGYTPTYTGADIFNQKIEMYKGIPYENYYEYGFPRDKDRPKKEAKPKPKPKPEKPKVEPNEDIAVVRTESPFPFNATKSVSRTLLMITKNKVRPMRTDYKVTEEFD